DLYLRRSDRFFDLVRLAGISEVVERPHLQVDAGVTPAQSMLSPSNLAQGLRSQAAVAGVTRLRGTRTAWHVGGAATVGASSQLVRLYGTNLDVLNDVAEVTKVGAPAICFSVQCPPGNDGLGVGRLNDVPPLPRARSQIRVGTSESFANEGWVDGDIAYTQGSGVPAAQLVPTAVGIARAKGRLTIPRISRSSRLWLEVLRSPSRVRYTVRCGTRATSRSASPTLAGYAWTWSPFG